MFIKRFLNIFKKAVICLSKNKIFFVVIFIAFVVRFVGLMPNRPNADEAFVQTHSWDLVHNIIKFGDFNPHTFKYGSWVFYLQGLSALPIFLVIYLIEGFNVSLSSSFTAKWLDFSLFYEEAIRKYDDVLLVFGRAQTALFGVLSVLVLYFIAKKLFNKRVGLISSLLLAVAPLHVRDSHYITTDVLSLFTILVAFLCLVYMMETKKWKWFVISGIALGISTTVRYYPIAFLAYPLAIVFSFTRSRNWIIKMLLSVIGIAFGVFLGMPFLFIEPNGFAHFMSDLEKYALPWYSTSISTYVFSLISSIFSKGKLFLPDIKMLYQPPKSFRYTHVSWIFFNAYGILPTIATLFGTLVTFFKSIKKFLFVAIIPLGNIIYISSFIPATYERLIIPSLPFMAILAGVGIDYLFELFSGVWNKERVYVVIGGVVLFMVILPLKTSFLASVACGKKSIQIQSHDWVEENISQEAKIGYLTMVSTPQVEYGAWEPLEPNYNLSLAEAQDLGLDHAFINAGRLDYNTYPFFNSFFVVPSALYENSYYSLVLSEYASRGRLLGMVRKPWMCDNSRIYYYKLPGEVRVGDNKLVSFDFNNKNDLDFWSVRNVDKTGEANINLVNGFLEYTQTPFNFVPPRIVSKEVSVKPGKIYTFGFFVKSLAEDEKLEDTLIARIDFYDKENGSFIENIREKLLLVNEGSTSMYFEKKREQKRVFSDTNLPGRVVSLSRLTRLTNKPQEVSVSAKVPDSAGFAIFSIQPISTNKLKILIDNSNISSN